MAMTDIEAGVMRFASGLPDGARVLDVGCGLRPYEKYFKRGEYIGIDVYESGREAEGKLADYEFDGLTIPLDTASFDAVICTEVLEHAVDADHLLSEISRVTKAGGSLFVTVPFMWGLHELPYDFRRYTSVGIQKKISEVGYDIVEFRKLTEGMKAIMMLISSETNYFVNVVSEGRLQSSLKFRLLMKLQNYLLIALQVIWKRTLRFERIYIDNLVIAKKSS